MIEHKAKKLKTPQHIKQYRNNKDFICIDYGIIKTIEWLWENRIETLGCCCGKGKKFGNRPSLVLPECYTDRDIDYIIKLIKQKDKRNWLITQWRNCEVSVKNKPKRPHWSGKDNLFPLPF